MTQLKDYRITQEFRLWASATVEAQSLQDAVRKIVASDVIDWDYETGDSEPTSDITVHPPQRDEPEVDATQYAMENNIVMNDEMTEQHQNAHPHPSTLMHAGSKEQADVAERLARAIALDSLDSGQLAAISDILPE